MVVSRPVAFLTAADQSLAMMRTGAAQQSAVDIEKDQSCGVATARFFSIS